MTQCIRTAALILLAASLAIPALAEDAATLYKAKCAMCHGADGLATSTMAKNLKVLSFKTPEMVNASDARFIASTANGKGAHMPPYKGKLTDAQIKEVVAYIRTLQK
jgi:mono/diheme cytochrome c family protein